MNKKEFASNGYKVIATENETSFVMIVQKGDQKAREFTWEKNSEYEMRVTSFDQITQKLVDEIIAPIQG